MNPKELDNISIEYQDLVEFRLSEDISLVYNETRNIWYAQSNDLEENSDIEIIEDLGRGIEMIADIYIFDTYLLTVEKFNKIKKITLQK